jgi:CubicO group peptidase (beta-lactamase class C family)
MMAIDTTLFSRHLLTHTLGLGYDLADPDLIKWSKAVGRTANCMDWSLDGFNTPIKFAPGDGWYYGTAMDWAGQVLEKVTKETVGAYMRKHIFGPLGMDDTTFRYKTLPHVSHRSVATTTRAKDGSLTSGSAPVRAEHPIESGGAGLFSTADDYGKFLHAFLAYKLINRETMDQMFTPQLNDSQRQMLNLIAYGSPEMFTPEFSQHIELTHGLGGMMNLEDVPGKRRKGSLTWSGMANSRWVSKSLSSDRA